MLTPSERYQRALHTEGFKPDPAQAQAIDYLQEIYRALIYPAPAKRWFRQKKAAEIRGLYLWGSVGIGKTWLMDLFFQSLPLKKKWRIHFHDFMLDIQDKLQRMQGTANPLDKIAKQIAAETRILCFDEFVVNDIGDAMILGNFFQALFKQGVIVVATSNVPPEDLYKNGLQRARFIPAIQQIKKHLHILHLPTKQDYRLRALETAGVFFLGDPLHQETNHQLKHLFEQLAESEIRWARDIYLYERPIETIAFANNIIWLEFKKLCSVPRSQADYLSIAKRWPVIIISNMPTITESENNIARYFINLIDILYDFHTVLILSAATSIENLYPQGELEFEFRRTKSRLFEMQSKVYLLEAARRKQERHKNG